MDHFLKKHQTDYPFDYYKEIILNYRDILPNLDIRKVEDYVMVSPKKDLILERLQMEVL